MLYSCDPMRVERSQSEREVVRRVVGLERNLSNLVLSLDETRTTCNRDLEWNLLSFPNSEDKYHITTELKYMFCSSITPQQFADALRDLLRQYSPKLQDYNIMVGYLKLDMVTHRIDLVIPTKTYNVLFLTEGLVRLPKPGAQNQTVNENSQLKTENNKLQKTILSLMSDKGDLTNLLEENRQTLNRERLLALKVQKERMAKLDDLTKKYTELEGNILLESIYSVLHAPCMLLDYPAPILLRALTGLHYQDSFSEMLFEGETCAKFDDYQNYNIIGVSQHKHLMHKKCHDKSPKLVLNLVLRHVSDPGDTRVLVLFHEIPTSRGDQIVSWLNHVLKLSEVDTEVYSNPKTCPVLSALRRKTQDAYDLIYSLGGLDENSTIEWDTVLIKSVTLSGINLKGSKSTMKFKVSFYNRQKITLHTSVQNIPMASMYTKFVKMLSVPAPWKFITM